MLKCVFDNNSNEVLIAENDQNILAGFERDIVWQLQVLYNEYQENTSPRLTYKNFNKYSPVVVPVVRYECTTWTLTNLMEKKLDWN